MSIARKRSNAGQQPRARGVRAGAIRVRNMRFWGKHGANPGEQLRAQPIDLDVSITMDLEPAARSDALRRTLDYRDIYAACESIVTGRSFRLLEALGDAIARKLWDPATMLGLSVRVRKPRLLEGATPEIEIFRRRKAT